MTRSVTFNGITRFAPGGITKINAEALNQVLLSANSIVALIGEAEGGAPGLTSGLATLADPSRAAAQYKSGALVDAVRLAFQSSGDPNILGGASKVLLWKTNNSTQASLSFPSANASEIVSSTVTGGAASTLVDIVGLNTGLFADTELVNMWVILRPFTATSEVRRVLTYDDASSTITVDIAWASVPIAAESYLLLENEVEVMDNVDVSGSSSTVVSVDNAGMVVDEHVGRWLYIVDTTSVIYLRQVVSNTVSAFTVTPSLPATSTDGAYVEVLPNALDLTSSDYGLHTNGITVDVDEGSAPDLRVITSTFEGVDEVSPSLGGTNFLHVLYRGASASISDTVAATPASTTTVIELTAGGLTSPDNVGDQVLVGTEYTTIISHTASQLTVSPALSAVPAVATPVVITALTKSSMEVSGAAGVASLLSITLTGVTGDDLAITFSASQTLRQLVDVINANSNYLATIPAGINADTTLVAHFDFGPSSSVSIHNTHALARTTGLRQDLKASLAFFNDISSLITAARSTDTGSTVAGGARLAAWNPANVLGTTDPFNLLGGTRGISKNSNFQSGFDALLKVRAHGVAPLVDTDLVGEGFGSTATVAAVAAQLSDHVTAARSAAQNIAGERGGFLGFVGNKTALIEQANAINNFDVQLVSQSPTVLNALGSLEEFSPRMLAVMAASMRAGVAEVGEPLTHKFLRVSGLSNDNSWDPADITDVNDLITAGILFAETIDGKGTRWVRDLTTHVKDDNLAYVEGSVRDVVRFIAFNLRNTLVARHTGRKAKPATISNMRDTAVGFLELARQDSIIVDSKDPATGASVRAWHNLKLFSSGDIVTLNVGIFPVIGVNFQLNELFLQIPTQSA